MWDLCWVVIGRTRGVSSGAEQSSRGIMGSGCDFRSKGESLARKSERCKRVGERLGRNGAN